MFYYHEDDTDLKAVADRIREAAGVETPLEFPDEFIQTIPDGIPKGLKIKYIIPATFTQPRTADNLSFATFDLTFTRENINQLFTVDWKLQDTTDISQKGIWIQDIFWNLFYQSNYSSMHLGNVTWVGAGKAGNHQSTNWVGVSKTVLTHTETIKANTAASADYTRLGTTYKGLIFIYDSTYDGQPMVDETKLSQFFDCDYITAGW